MEISNIIYEISRIIVVTICFLILALLAEFFVHRQYTLEELARQLKADVSSVIRILSNRPTYRHSFAPWLFDDLIEVVQPYANAAFEPNASSGFCLSAPCICVCIVPDRQLTPKELAKISDLLLVKFRQYLNANQLNWQTFSDFSRNDRFATFYLFYAELEADLQPFSSCYRQKLARRAPKTSVLVDEELEREMRNG